MKLRLAVLIGLAAALAAPAGDKKVPDVLNFKMKDINGKEVDLSRYQGKVVMFVNVASQCGYTKQYAGLEKLYEKYKDKGFVLVGVPANNFGAQEPGSDAEIKEFCSTKFGVKFDMMSKVSVDGDDTCPLYKFLTSKETDPKHAGPVKWNFEKFLISKDGQVVERFRSAVKPEDKQLTEAIEREVAK